MLNKLCDKQTLKKSICLLTTILLVNCMQRRHFENVEIVAYSIVLGKEELDQFNLKINYIKRTNYLCVNKN